jgi:uncharacterized protein (TIGR00730 family)
MRNLSSICVYCGSSGNVSQSFRDAATALGRLLGENGIALIYGGGKAGLMGLVADAALSAGGSVVGVITRHLEQRELAHKNLSELIVVETMHQRKHVMMERSDAFAVLPGGLGTLEEMFEILSWKQLGLHDRPIILVDIEGYWNPVQVLIRHAVSSGFAELRHANLLRSVAAVSEILPALEADF